MIINNKYDSWFGIKIKVDKFTPDNLLVRYCDDYIAINQELFNKISVTNGESELKEVLKGVMFFDCIALNPYSRLMPCVDNTMLIKTLLEVNNG